MKKQIEILLVEDEPEHVELIKHSLTSGEGNYHLSVVRSLADARNFLVNSPSLDLIMADWRLPDGSGSELMAPGHSLNTVPVVIMTSFGNEKFAVDVLKMGALDYVVKSEVTLLDMPPIIERSLRGWNNILERKRSEQALTESEARYRSLFENALVGIYRTNRDGKILDANPYLIHLLGYSTGI